MAIVKVQYTLTFPHLTHLPDLLANYTSERWTASDLLDIKIVGLTCCACHRSLS